MAIQLKQNESCTKVAGEALYAAINFPRQATFSKAMKYLDTHLSDVHFTFLYYI